VLRSTVGRFPRAAPQSKFALALVEFAANSGGCVTTVAMPLARLTREMVYVGVLALVFFALMRFAADKWNIPALRAVLGASGTLN